MNTHSKMTQDKYMKKNTKSAIKFSVAVLAVVLCVSFLVSSIFGSRVTAVASVKAEPASFAHSTARGMAVLEVSSGRLLYGKNETTRLSMASTTKIVTAITVLENTDDLDTPFKVHPKSIGIEGTSIYLQRDEMLTVRELLYGLMLRSGNDASVALALRVAPSIEAFAELMNELSRKAGAMDSSWKNPHGLDEDGHYTTALDLAKISAYAMRNETFREIVGTKNIKINGAEYPRVMQNKNRLLSSLDGCVGVKTGFTKKAGRTYVGAREYNGMTVVCVVLNCGPMFPESAELMKKAATEFKFTKLLSADEFITMGDFNQTVGIAREDFFYPLKAGENVRYLFNDDIVTITLDGKEIYKANFNKL